MLSCNKDLEWKQIQYGFEILYFVLWNYETLSRSMWIMIMVFDSAEKIMPDLRNIPMFLESQFSKI